MFYLRAKQGGKSDGSAGDICSSRDSDFASQNKEENPLLVKRLGFCFAKQGGLDIMKKNLALFLACAMGVALVGCDRNHCSSYR